MNEMFVQYGVAEYMNAPFTPTAVHTINMFNIPVWRREIFENKIRYYLFGINIATKRLY